MKRLLHKRLKKRKMVRIFGQLTAYVWELDGENYYTYRILEGEYRGKCESFLMLCEQDGITFSTEEEMEKLIKKRQKELGIQEEWLEEKELVWHTYYDEKYKDYVKMIHLSEHNRQRKATEEYPMDDLWVICETGKADGEELNSYIDSRAEGALQGLSWEWEESVGYAVMDYCTKNNISAKNWIIKDVMSIEDDRYLFFLQGEEGRELYLLINPMAYRLGIPKLRSILAMELRIRWMSHWWWNQDRFVHLSWIGFLMKSRREWMLSEYEVLVPVTVYIRGKNRMVFML